MNRKRSGSSLYGTAKKLYSVGRKAYDTYTVARNIASQLKQLPKGYGGKSSGFRPSRMIGGKRFRQPRTVFTSGGKFPRAKRWARTKRNQKAKQGISIKQEYGGTLIGGRSDASYIGHATCPLATTRLTIFAAIVKEVALKAGWDVSSLNNTTPISGRMLFNYRLSALAPNITSQNFDYAVNVTTYYSIAVAMRTHFEGLGAEVFFERIEHVIGNDSAPFTEVNMRQFVDLKDATVRLTTKSSLKMQNRTVEAPEDDEADNVDNVPLYGKQYDGRGSGTVPFKYNQFAPPGVNGYNLSAESTHGYLLLTGTSGPGFEELREPPPAKFWQNVTKAAKARLEPGKVRTSVLFHKSYVKLNYIWNTLYEQSVAALHKKPVNFGKFRLFGFEKMINVSNTTLSMKIGYELNTELSCVLYPKQSTATTPWYNTQAYAAQ